MSYWRLLNDIECELAALKLVASALHIDQLLRKYDPNQPRVPAGRPDGGQWTRVAGIGGISGGEWDNGNWDKCEAQYERDMFQCRMILNGPACRNQAMLRLVNCMKNEPLAPFNY